MRDQPETLHPKTTPFPALTLEATLYTALALVALFLRLFVLGNAPLAADEARQALASWHFVQAAPDDFTGSPLLFTGNALLFALFGATDTAARILPALFGSALVLLPALLRRELGRAGALIASFLIAFSPSLIFFSRDLNGAVIAVTCALAALAFAWRYLTDHTPRALFFAAAAAALALLAAREVWTIVLAIALFALFVRIVKWSDNQMIGDHTTMQLRNYVTVFAVVFIGIATTFFFHRDGIGASFDLFGAWLAGLRPSGALSDPLRLLVVYEPISLFIGVAALIQLGFMLFAGDREQTPLIAIGFWSIVALVLYSIGGDKNPARIVVLVVPLALVAGWYLGNWVEPALQATHREIFLAQELPVALLAFALAAFLYLLFAELATRGSTVAIDVLASAVGQPGNGGIIIAGLMALALAAIMFLMVASVGWTRAKDVGLTVLLLLLAAWTFRQAIVLNFPAGGARNPQELAVARAASANVRDLVHDLEDTSRWRADDSHTLKISVDESLSPVVAWNLRNFRNAHFVARPAASEGSQAIVLPATAPAPASGWMSQTYEIETARSANGVSNLLRWLIFRDVGTIESAKVVLWMPPPK